MSAPRKHAKNPVLKIVPATLLDMSILADNVHATRVQWGVIREIFEKSQAWALGAGEDLLGVAGFVPIGPDEAETWFHFTPEARDYMLPIVRAIRLTVARAPYRAIVTLCTSKEGARICRAAGFVFARHSDYGEVWAYAGSTGWGRGESGTVEPAAHEPGAIGTAAGPA